MVFKLRSRSFGARKQRRGVSFKKRASSVGSTFRKGSKRISFSKKSKFVKLRSAAKRAFKVAKFKNKNTSRLLTLTKGVADQVFVFNYVDQLSASGTTGQPAEQLMWGIQNTTVGTAGATNQPLVNLQLMSNDILQMVMGQAGGGGSSSLATSQMIVKSYETSMEIRNLTTGPINLWEYRCTARKDLSGGSGGGSLPNLNAIILNGFADAAARTGGSIPFTSPMTSVTLGATPFMNPRFVASIKIRKVKKWSLNPARAKRLKYSTKKPRMIKAEDFLFGVVPDGDGSTALSRQISKGQSFSVFVISGTFASNVSGAAGFLAGIGAADVGVTASIKMHYCNIATNTMSSAATTAVAGFTGGVARYPAPIVLNQPISAISTGPVPAAAGTRTYGLLDTNVVVDTIMIGP